MSGKATIAQDIESTRLNHPDIIAAFGEYTDNSTSWGDCNKGIIFLERHRTIIVDDGEFDEKRIKSAFCKVR